MSDAAKLLFRASDQGPVTGPEVGSAWPPMVQAEERVGTAAGERPESRSARAKSGVVG